MRVIEVKMLGRAKPLAKIRVPVIVPKIKELVITLTVSYKVIFVRVWNGKPKYTTRMSKNDFITWLTLKEQDQHAYLAKRNIARISQYARKGIISIAEFNLLLAYIRNVLYKLHKIAIGQLPEEHDLVRLSELGNKKQAKKHRKKIKRNLYVTKKAIYTYGQRISVVLAKERYYTKKEQAKLTNIERKSINTDNICTNT